MTKYRKLGVAVIGLISIILLDFFEIKLPFMPEQAWDMLISMGIAGGVWAAPNA